MHTVTNTPTHDTKLSDQLTTNVLPCSIPTNDITDDMTTESSTYAYMIIVTHILKN